MLGMLLANEVQNWCRIQMSMVLLNRLDFASAVGHSGRQGYRQQVNSSMATIQRSGCPPGSLTLALFIGLLVSLRHHDRRVLLPYSSKRYRRPLLDLLCANHEDCR